MLEQTPVAPVYLIGFMCSGKSTVGRALAAILGIPLVDLDREVERRVGPLVPFFQTQGEAAFRLQERAVLEEASRGAVAVVATGGGTPCEGDNLALMKATGTVVWLDVPMDALMPRIERAGGDRPLLLGLKGEALHARVAALMAERESTYQDADMIVQASAPPTVVAQRIADALRMPQVR